MYCSRCGTQIPDDSAFCENCGSPVAGVERERRRREAEAAAAAAGAAAPVGAPVGAVPAQMQPPPAAGAPPAYAPTQVAPPPYAAQPPRPMPVARPAMQAAAGTLPLVGIIAIAGGLLAVIGSLVAWLDPPAGADVGGLNGFGWGYITDSNGIDGADGFMILPLAVIAAGLGALFFRQVKPLAGIGLLAVGAAILAVAGWNLWKIFDNSDSSLEFVGMGLYVTLAGGAAAVVAGFIAMSSGRRI